MSDSTQLFAAVHIQKKIIKKKIIQLHLPDKQPRENGKSTFSPFVDN